jgi:hypothetical protein
MEAMDILLVGLIGVAGIAIFLVVALLIPHDDIGED